MRKLQDKVAIVTVSTHRRGRRAAVRRRGAKVALTARRRAELDRRVAEITQAGGEAAAVAGDIRDEATVQAAVDMALERFGGLDAAFNNAGALPPAPRPMRSPTRTGTPRSR